MCVVKYHKIKLIGQKFIPIKYQNVATLNNLSYIDQGRPKHKKPEGENREENKRKTIN